MVKTRSGDVMNEGGGSYLSIEKAMKKKKKRKNPPPDPDIDPSNLVASNVDPSLLVKVPHDNRVNVDGVLDQQLQLDVKKWSQTDLSMVDKNSSGCPAVLGNLVNAPQSGINMPNTLPTGCSADVISKTGDALKCKSSETIKSAPRPCEGSGNSSDGDSIVGCLIEPQLGKNKQNALHAGCSTEVVTETGDALKSKNSGKTKSVLNSCEGSGTSSGDSQKAPLAGLSLVFKAGCSGLIYEAKAIGSRGRGPKSAVSVVQHARMAKLRGSDTRMDAGIAPIRSNPATPLSTGPAATLPKTVPAGLSPDGSKVRPKFSEIIKDNRIVANGLKLQQYDLMENDDDLILDESDEIPLLRLGAIV
ncbi:hypothetical protein LIER_04798 [Lithospermum erythrorhizon]|uniref:Uncharacterized protein n=1 Tax=Lithospermum erythrorhizon TaxID=34254 RepID=A0AAV3NY08_LITER